MPDTPRYQPSRAFPPYAYVPGRHPHPAPAPTSTAEQLTALDPEYLWGIDLYNHGYFWEAHEAWEGIWRGVQSDPVQRTFLQGLIQCTAACLKALLGDVEACRRLAARGLARLDAVPTDAVGCYMGLAVAQFAARFRDYAAAEPAQVAQRPHLELRLSR